MGKHDVHNDLISRIREYLSPLGPESLKIEKETAGLIRVTSVPSSDFPHGIDLAHADMALFDENDQPIMIIEPETASSPKTFGRSITVYSMASEIQIRQRRYPLMNGFLLVIVIPDHKIDLERKRRELSYIGQMAKASLSAGNRRLKDIVICQIADIECEIDRILRKNGNISTASRIKKKVKEGSRC